MSLKSIAIALCSLLVCVRLTGAQSVEKSMKNEGAVAKIYKQTQDAQGKPVALNAYIFFPEGHQATDERPAVVFFSGGGWNSGSPKQFSQHCQYLASRGMVAITADYRVKSRQQTQAKECVADGKSAIRWARKNASMLGIDPDRIVAGGGSAGGHVAACTGTLPGFDEPSEDSSVSSRPNAMALFNPAVLLATFGDFPVIDSAKAKALRQRMGTDPKNLSPIHHVDSSTPPTIIFHGTEDKTVPFRTVKAFTDESQAKGVICRLCEFEGEGHGFFNYRRGGNSNFEKTMEQLDGFLVEQGFLEPK